MWTLFLRKRWKCLTVYWSAPQHEWLIYFWSSFIQTSLDNSWEAAYDLISIDRSQIYIYMCIFIMHVFQYLLIFIFSVNHFPSFPVFDRESLGRYYPVFLCIKKLPVLPAMYYGKNANSPFLCLKQVLVNVLIFKSLLCLLMWVRTNEKKFEAEMRKKWGRRMINFCKATRTLPQCFYWASETSCFWGEGRVKSVHLKHCHFKLMC